MAIGEGKYALPARFQIRSTCAECGLTFDGLRQWCTERCMNFAIQQGRYIPPASWVSDADFETYRLEIMAKMTDQSSMEDALPAFDPKSKCAKCGWMIEEPPVTPPKVVKGADGKSTTTPAPPPPPPRPPTVAYCNGLDCPWSDEPTDEHLHQFCDTCGYEWLATPLS